MLRPPDQLFLLLIATLALFIWGRWRYDLVALGALLVASILGLVDPNAAFTGFGDPAVVTVAGILVLSRGLINSGAVEPFARALGGLGASPTALIAGTGTAVAFLSAFMNNVGALAIMMPVSIRLARQNGLSPATLLMPLAFCSLLGGLITEIGTPPNLYIARYRGVELGAPFRMFDFAPVGLTLAVAGIAFVALGGWRLIPRRRVGASAEELFQIKSYATEVSVPPKSKLVGKSLRELRLTETYDVLIIGIIRGDQRLMAPSSLEVVHENDVLIMETSSEALKGLLSSTDLKAFADERLEKDLRDASDVSVFEAIVAPASYTIGRTAKSLNLRWRYALNLVAVARQGERLAGRIGSVILRQGDILLLQGRPTAFQETMSILGWLPLADRGMKLSDPKGLLKSSAIFLAAIAAVALQWIPVQIAFALGALLMILTKALTMREAYAAIEWPIIVLLAAMIPLGDALKTTGADVILADGLRHWAGDGGPYAALLLLATATILLTNIINNFATIVLMAPIALSIADGFGVSPDPFLMVTAVAASSAFLTPIGHQANILVMGPAGYRFGDYWRLGLPMTLLTLGIAAPLIWWWWNLRSPLP